MGSFGDDEYAKGENPELSWVQRGINRHNAAVRARFAAAPVRLRLLALFGIQRPLIAWQRREPLQRYYPPE